MNDNWWGWINLMGERFIGGLVADEVGGGGGGGGEDCLASTAAKGLSVLLLFLAVGIIPSTQSACRRTLWFLDHWTGQRSKEQWTLHFCALSLLQLCIKHVKQIPVNEILQFQSETSWSWKCLFDNWLCTTFFGKYSTKAVLLDLERRMKMKTLFWYLKR